MIHKEFKAQNRERSWRELLGSMTLIGLHDQIAPPSKVSSIWIMKIFGRWSTYILYFIIFVRVEGGSSSNGWRTTSLWTFEALDEIAGTIGDSFVLRHIHAVESFLARFLKSESKRRPFGCTWGFTKSLRGFSYCHGALHRNWRRLSMTPNLAINSWSVCRM